MAVRAAISESFKTPEVIRMFAKKEPAALRRRLAEIDRDVKLGKHAKEAVAEEASARHVAQPRHRGGREKSDACARQVTEILTALSKLGEQLSTGEESFLEARTPPRRRSPTPAGTPAHAARHFR